MLRRAPTTITLTQADIEQYEANRQRKIWEQQQQAAAAQATISSSKAKEQSGPQQKTRKDRIMGGRSN